VQFFALSRGLCRYGERLVGHDAAFRVLADLRVRVYERLERLAPLGLPAFRSGELLARLVHDVDSLQDLLLRVLPAFALVVSARVVGLVWWPPGRRPDPAGGTGAPGVPVPWLTGMPPRAPRRGGAAARGIDGIGFHLLEGAPELLANGAAAVRRLRAPLVADARSRTSPARRARRASARGRRARAPGWRRGSCSWASPCVPGGWTACCSPGSL
jgi:hypothetical protein